MNRILAYSFILLGISAVLTARAETRIEPLSEVPTFPVNNGPVDVENSFTKGNPYYKQRAGTFYETEYLGFSAALFLRSGTGSRSLVPLFEEQHVIQRVRMG